jgi:glycosyltransferase involved in cell wall biosynthesis
VRAGDRVTVLTPHARGVAARREARGVDVLSFRYAPERFEVLGYGRSLESDERVRSGSVLVAPSYALAARQAVARLLRRRHFDLVHAHWVVPNGLVAAHAVGKTPLAIGLHGSDVFLAEKRGVRTLVRQVLSRTALVTGCSPELVERVVALGSPGQRAAVIPYGVDSRLFDPTAKIETDWRGRFGIPRAAPLLLGVGRMVVKKGFAVLFAELERVLSAFPLLHVVLAGGGDELAPLQASAARWPQVHFTGPLLRDTLPDLYRTADLFVLPAVHDRKGNVDGLPNVILEAMASGLPVVASGISGIPLAVLDGVTGRLVPEGDASALAAAIIELLADPERARRMGAAGRQRSIAELSWDAVARRYHEAYVGALERRS